MQSSSLGTTCHRDEDILLDGKSKHLSKNKKGIMKVVVSLIDDRACY